MHILLLTSMFLLVCVEGQETLYSEIRTGKPGQPFIITTIHNKPFLMQKPHSNRETGNELYYGFVPDFTKYLSEALNFTYVLRPETQYGSKTEDGKWTGMVGQIVDRKADFAIADLTITAERQRVVDFSMSFMTTGIGLLMSNEMSSDANMSPWVFLAPFESAVWSSTFIAFLGLSIGLFVLGRFSPADWLNTEQMGIAQRSNQFSVSNTLFFMTGSMTGQNTQLVARGLSTRLLSITWWVFCFFAAAMYVANLAAILVHHLDVISHGPKIQSVDDLVAQSAIKYGTLAHGSTHHFFKVSGEPIYQQIHTIMESDPSVMVNSYADGVAKVKNGSYALFMEATSIEYLTERDCSLVRVGKLLNYKNFGVAMMKDSPMLVKFNQIILHALEDGTLQRLKNKWFKLDEPLVCDDERTVNIRGSLMLRNFRGIFTILLVGVGLSLLVGFFEMFCRARAAARQQGGTISAELKREARYAVFGGVAPTKDNDHSRTDDIVLGRQES